MGSSFLFDDHECLKQDATPTLKVTSALRRRLHTLQDGAGAAAGIP